MQQKRGTLDLKNLTEADLIFFSENLVLLQEQVIRITAMKAALKNLGYMISDEELSDMHNKLKIIMELQTDCEALKDVMAKLKGDIDRVRLKATDATQQGLLTEDECQEVEIATSLTLANPRNGEVSRLAGIFQESDQPVRKEIGEDLNKIAVLAQKLIALLDKIKTFFQQAAKTWLFFDKSQHYESGPVPSDSPEEEPPIKGPN
ncbi:hypothetical protein [Legionella tunisiensis]|uniref:hypothetical protein n=1 Tax=Legionella tunisiensis TaxID=1034944 RepID=UPI0002FDB98A|nr:hypothetical protein [Legionella tunisiensis]